jgi:hypothetical protein
MNSENMHAHFIKNTNQKVQLLKADKTWQKEITN